MITVQLMGSLVVRVDGQPVAVGGPRQRTVMALLALSPRRAIHPDRLVTLVWGDDPPPSARATLQSYVSNLRRALAPGAANEGRSVLPLGPGGYLLDLPPGAVDTEALERSVAAGLADRAAGDRDGAAAHLETALRDAAPLLPELAEHPCVAATADRLRTVRATATEVALELRLERGEHLAALPLLRTAVDEHPRHERLWAALALALYRAGRQAEAIATIHTARAALRDLAGIEPGPDLRRLEAELLDQSPTLDLLIPAGQTPIPSAPARAQRPRPTIRLRPAPEPCSSASRFRPRACSFHPA